MTSPFAFLAFRAEIAQNIVKPEKTGFGMAITARPRPVFCVFGVKKLRTFYFNLTEQSRRKNLAEGGFEPEKVRLLYPAPLKKPLLWECTNCSHEIHTDEDDNDGVIEG